VIGGVGKVRDEEPQKKLDSLGAFLKSLGGGNSNISGIFTPILGEMIHFDEYVSDGVGSTTHQIKSGN